MTIKYPIYLVPGPVQVPVKIRAVYAQEFSSPDLDIDFLDLYIATEKLWQQIMHTKNSIAIMTGEAMLGLWSGLKSCLKAGDKVLAINNGLFGAGIAEMAKTIGAQVEMVNFDYDEPTTNLERIDKAIQTFKPKMITAVHCETPSGILNPIAAIGELKKKHNIPLFYVDAVASIGGTSVNVDAWQIDICLGGGQKAPSIFADISFIAVSQIAWEIIEKIDYAGYDALKPFQNAVKNAYFPYTPHWHGVAALHESANLLLTEGLENVFLRHQKCAELCRKEIIAIGFDLFPRDLNYASPTVTAIKVPEWISWKELDAELRKRGVLLGGNYGILNGKVFRIGHMGTQADLTLVEHAMEILGEIKRAQC